jgi:putative SOS response-associated peptidase YedK
MCNEFSQTKITDVIAALGAGPFPEFGWRDGMIPNLPEDAPPIRIRDKAVVVRLQDGVLEGAMTPWAWPSPKGAPVFNFRSEGRDFSHNDRVLIPADAFYEYTAPQAKGVKLKDRHRFTMAGEPWFWIAGLVKEGCFTLLTTEPGPDVAPYHDRQIVTFAPAVGLDWLTLSRPMADMLRPPPGGTFTAQTVRKDGVEAGVATQGSLF